MVTLSHPLPNAVHDLAGPLVAVEQPDVLGPNYDKGIREIILGIMFIVALIGNHRVLWKLREKWAKRGRMTTMAFNLTLADIFVTYFSLLGQLIWELLDRRWYLPNFACKLFKVCQTFAMTSSNYMLVAIAIDRYVAVIRPLNAFISSRNLALAAWSISLLPSLPSFFIFLKVEPEDGNAYCVSKFYTNDLNKDFRKAYMFSILGSVFILPLFLLLVLYLRIYVELWRKNTFFFKGEMSNDSRRSNNTLPKAKSKTLKMTIVITVTFFITNLPYIFQEMILSFHNQDSINQYLIALFGIISASNSCFNPFIYLYFSPKTESPANGSFRVTFTRRSTSSSNSYREEQQMPLNGGPTVTRNEVFSVPIREHPWT
ncbi:unnamed protein product, partial [Meganyctiphanes norvegica]